MKEHKTEKAKSLLVRYIRDRKMKRGDRLPPQDSLRRLFQFGTATISSAINSLKEDGVLEVRDKVGVFVIDPNADGHAGRTIGITMRHAENSLYYSAVLTAVQMRLVEEGCMIRLFHYQNEQEGQGIFFQIDDFPGLRRSLEEGELQGLIHLDDFTGESLSFIRRKQIPCVFIGSPGGIAQNGIFFDQRGFIRSASEILKGEPVQKTALICQTSLMEYLRSEFFACFGKDQLIWHESSTDDAAGLAEQFATMSAEEMPRRLIFTDDIFALAFTCRLAVVLPPERQPEAVIMRNRQFRLSYPIRRAFYFDSDLSELAARGVSLLMDAMKSGNFDTGKINYLPEYTNSKKETPS